MLARQALQPLDLTTKQQPCFVMGFLEIGSPELFALGWL
jgi:hypothetical protein